jgi:Outer membrane lipoprotein-sorting protein
MLKKMCIVFVIWMFAPFSNLSNAETGSDEAQKLVVDSFNYWRGKASVALVDMVIHRPDWQRRVTIKAWTIGEKDSLFRIAAPAKDKGNGTLKRGREMWMYNPKVNRVIKLPPSMMSQSWMGSDFSNNDLSKSDSLLTDYQHKIVGTETHNGKKVYLIESLPLPTAPVIWGMQKLKIREDLIFLSQAFYDEDFKLVKALRFLEIQMLGDRLYPKKWVMQKAGETDAYTIVEYKELAFKQSLPESIFTLSSLKNPRR